MQFEIYNKLKTPIYVDWCKSFYIDNKVKLNYWEDVELTNALYLCYYYESAFLGRRSAGFSNSTKTKDERITFIPPKAKYLRSQFYIISRSFTVLDKNGPFTEIGFSNGIRNKGNIPDSTHFFIDVQCFFIVFQCFIVDPIFTI